MNRNHNFLTVLLIIGLCINCSASFAFCADSAKNAPLKDMSGQKIETEYYTVTIPQGWSMPMPIQKNPQGYTAIFGIVQGKLAVTISILKGDMPAKALAESTINNIRKKGINAGSLQEKNGFYFTHIDDKIKGDLYFGSDDGIRSSISIFGEDPARANELFSSIQCNMSHLIPGKIE